MTRRRPVPVAAVLVVVAVVAAGLAGVAAVPAAASGARGPAPTSCLPAGEAASATKGPYAVGERTATFVDPSRPTAADPSRGIPAASSRTLVTTILYPSSLPTSKVAARAKPPVAGAPVAPGSFPLVEFSPGWTATGPEYVSVLQWWARQGYVVAAPTFPLTSGAGASPLDVVNQPGDVSFVITSMDQLSADASDPLFGHVAPGCDAVAGHSLGAITTLATVYSSAYGEPRARAAIEISGALLPLDGGTYQHPPAVPLLLLHGDQDDTVNISYSQQAFSTLVGSRWFVTFHGAGHVSLFTPPWNTELLDAVVSFLNDVLKGDSHLKVGFPERVARSGVATLQTAS